VSRRLTTALLIVLVSGAALTACAPKPAVSDEAAEGLQASVLVVAESAAASDLARAVTELDALQARFDAAVGSGDVSDERSEKIQAAIDLVRADLAEQVAAAEAAAAKAAADKAAADKLAAEQKAAADKAAAEQAEKDKDKGNDKGGPGKGDDKDDED
jgi:hypothetical protein